MSEINQPKEVVPDDERLYLAPELGSYYDFEGQLYDEELSEQDEEELAIVANYDDYVNIKEIEEFALSNNSTPAVTFLPPRILALLNATYARGSDGTTYVDYEFEVEHVDGALEYEIRVLEME